MNAPARVVSKLRYLLTGRRPRQEFEQEVEDHIALLAERCRARGMSRAEASQAARRQFGNLTNLKETRHDMQTTIWKLYGKTCAMVCECC